MSVSPALQTKLQGLWSRAIHEVTSLQTSGLVPSSLTIKTVDLEKEKTGIVAIVTMSDGREVKVPLGLETRH